MRDARNTTQLVAALCSSLSDGDLSEISDGLRYYMTINQPQEEKTLTPQEAAERKARKQK